MAHDVEKPILISGKAVEEVGFNKIRKIQADLHELKIVLLDGMCMSRPSARKLPTLHHSSHHEKEQEKEIEKTCPKITELDLSRNLFEEWREISSICAQLLQLRSLRVE